MIYYIAIIYEIIYNHFNVFITNWLIKHINHYNIFKYLLQFLNYNLNICYSILIITIYSTYSYYIINYHSTISDFLLLLLLLDNFFFSKFIHFKIVWIDWEYKIQNKHKTLFSAFKNKKIVISITLFSFLPFSFNYLNN